MTKRNFFTAALESEAMGAVSPEDVTNQSTMQPKPGVGEGDEVPSEEKPAKEFGEDHPFSEADEIDAVAESQEHTLALEHLQTLSLRFCRMASALEEIAENVENQLEAGQPLTPETATLLTTAVDAAGIGSPLGEVVANESFDFSANVATESFVEAIKDRAKRIWAAVAKFARKAWEVTTQKLKRFSDYFRSLSSVYKSLEKEGEILSTNAGKPFQNSKWEAKVQARVSAPSSTKSIPAAVANSLAEYEDVQKVVNGRLASDIVALKASWKTEKAENVVAQMNKVLANGRVLAEVGQSRWKHASCLIEVNLPERVTLQNTGGLEATKVVYEAIDHDYSVGLKTASLAEVKALAQSAERASNVLKAAWNNYYNAALEEENKEGLGKFFDYLERGSFSDEQRDVSRKLLVKYSNLMRVMTDLINATVYSVADGLYDNHFAAVRWIRFSIAEAKAASTKK